MGDIRGGVTLHKMLYDDRSSVVCTQVIKKKINMLCVSCTSFKIFLYNNAALWV